MRMNHHCEIIKLHLSLLEQDILGRDVFDIEPWDPQQFLVKSDSIRSLGAQYSKEVVLFSEYHLRRRPLTIWRFTFVHDSGLVSCCLFLLLAT